MGLTCNHEERRMYDKENPRRSSCKEKIFDDICNFPPIDNDDDDEKRGSKKDNVKIQKSKKINTPTSNSTNNDQTKNKNKNNVNDNQKKKANKNTEEIPKNNKNNSYNDDDNINDTNYKIKSYLDFNNNGKYYLVCPDCKNKVPFIKDTEYDTYRDDFIIEYFCNCYSNEEYKKAYLINFISNKLPENVAFSFESLEKIKSMLDTVRYKQDEFQGFQILDKIYKEISNLRNKMSFNKSMAPPANMQKSLVENKNN